MGACFSHTVDLQDFLYAVSIVLKYFYLYCLHHEPHLAIFYILYTIYYKVYTVYVICIRCMCTVHSILHIYIYICIYIYIYVCVCVCEHTYV